MVQVANCGGGRTRQILALDARYLEAHGKRLEVHAHEQSVCRVAVAGPQADERHLAAPNEWCLPVVDAVDVPPSALVSACAEPKSTTSSTPKSQMYLMSCVVRGPFLLSSYGTRASCRIQAWLGSNVYWPSRFPGAAPVLSRGDLDHLTHMAHSAPTCPVTDSRHPRPAEVGLPVDAVRDRLQHATKRG